MSLLDIFFSSAFLYASQSDLSFSGSFYVFKFYFEKYFLPVLLKE